MTDTALDETPADQFATDIGDGDDGIGSGMAERVLNQDEIDNLLGFDLGDDDGSERSGIRAIINSALVSYERLPMLETVDSNLIYSIVDVLLGGRRGTAALRIEGRPYTTIERVLVQRMVEVVLADAQAAFEPLTPVHFNLDRLETNPRFAAIARPANAAILVKLRIDMEDRGGRIELLLPYATLEPIRKMLLQQFMGEKFGRDNIWEGHLATELWTTDTEVRAVLDEQQVPLSSVLNFKVGDTLMLNATPDSDISIRCGSIPVTTGKMGRRGQNIAVRVENPINVEAASSLTRGKR